MTTTTAHDIGNTTGTSADEYGNPVVGSTEAVERYDTAVDLLLRFHPDVVDQATSLVHDHPGFAMGQVMWSYLHLMSTDARDIDTATAAVRALHDTSRGPREDAHLTALTSWLAGDWHGAARHLDDLLVQWPADVLALQIGHQLDFFVGDARNLRDRVGRSIDAFDPADPRTGFIRGLQAFGLEESGHYDRALETGIAAVEQNRDDVWAIHAVTHVHEMRGDTAAGLDFLGPRVDDWGSGNLFTVHIWWHLALLELESADHGRVLDIYDAHVAPRDESVAIDLADTSALLWRLHLEGVDVGERAAAASDAWTQVLDGQTGWYVFNEAHAAMAHVAAGRAGDADDVVRRLESRLADDANGIHPSSRRMITGAGLPACRALLAFGREQYDQVVGELWPTRRTFHHFGGSHAQRDALERTLLEAAVRAGRHDLARRLVSERLAVRPSGRFALDRLSRIGRLG